MIDPEGRSRRGPQMSATPHSTLANPDQRIADLERQLAECKTERDEARQRETPTAEVLQVINSSPGNLAPVFDAILQKAHSLCGASKGSLVAYDGQDFRSVATRGLSERYTALLRQPRGDAPASPLERLLRGERVVHIADIRTEDDPISRTAARLEGCRTVLLVPLCRDGALLGYITAYRQEVRPFSNKQITLLQNFAAQAGHRDGERAASDRDP